LLNPKQKRLMLSLAGSVIVFVIFHRLWFFIMGGFAVFGAIHAVREYLRRW